MFLVRYLMVAVTLVLGIVLWGLIDGLGFWQIARIAGLAVLALQGAVLVLVAVLAMRQPPPPPRTGTSRVNARRRFSADHSAILPK